MQATHIVQRWTVLIHISGICCAESELNKILNVWVMQIESEKIVRAGRPRLRNKLPNSTMENQFATEAHPIGFSRQLIRNSHFFYPSLTLCRLKLINVSSIIWATFEMLYSQRGRRVRGKAAWRRDLALGSCASSFGVKLREWWYLHYCKLLILLEVANRLHKQHNDTKTKRIQLLHLAWSLTRNP